MVTDVTLKASTRGIMTVMQYAITKRVALRAKPNTYGITTAIRRVIPAGKQERRPTYGITFAIPNVTYAAKQEQSSTYTMMTPAIRLVT